MKQVLNYLKNISKEDREQFAADVGTTTGYLNQIAHGYKKVGPEFAVRMEAFSKKALNAEELCPEFPWDYCRKR